MRKPGRRCPECATRLAIHQPDARQPDRLLGTCVVCGTWCLLDGRMGLVAILPTHGQVVRRGHQGRRHGGPEGGRGPFGE